MNRRVEGIYTTVEEAMSAVQRLRDEGYSRSEIYLVANADVRNNIPYTMDAEVTTDTDMTTGTTGRTDDDDRSLWEKIKDAFTVDEDYDPSVYDDPNYDTANDPLYAHRDDLDRGNIIVMLDADDTSTAAGMTGYNTMGEGVRAGEAVDGPDTLGTEGNIVDRDRDRNLRADTDMDRTDLDRDETIELREENLDVDTREVETGEVRIGKRVVEDTETIDVPVTHEEVTIERRPVTDRRAADGDMDFTDEEIVIPVTEEQVQIDKHAQVVEEVDVNKEQVTEQKRVSETVRREELDVDTTGNIHVDDDHVHHDHDHTHHDHDDRSILDKGRDMLDPDNNRRDTHRDGGILDNDADRGNLDREGGIFDNDANRGTIGQDGGILDADAERRTTDTDDGLLDNDPNRRTMDTDRGLFDDDPDRDRRI